nr:immunoglobulin light chain junction region [Mus musculus]NSL98410.1 immunoglobulin light chain junction region [Mus musculus]NSL98842.1 immunoglobulin light chain junction region [Mus musculus]NSL99757.1 immunoglobulin light chain junction region [Mus musculus]NSL99923.1 immunoglobulin light chain junction region [Mus musculus]
CQQYWSTPFTF